MTNTIIKYNYSKKKFIDRQLKKSENRKFLFADRIREKVILKPIKPLPDTTIFPTDGILVSNEARENMCISYGDFKKLKLNDGDKIYFERGKIYNWSTYTVSANSIRFGAFGTGDDPKRMGSIDISSLTWTDDGGDIFYGTVATEPKWVFRDGVELPMAQTDWITSTGRPSSTTITAAQATLQALDGVEELEGSYFIGKEFAYRPTYRRTVTAYNGTTQLTMNDTISPGTGGVGAGYPFRLLGKVSFITDVGEWAWDSVTQRLYVKTAGGAPTNIRICNEDYAIVVDDGVTGFILEDSEFCEYFLDCIYSNNNNGLTIQNCFFHDGRQSGVYAKGNSTNVTITNNTFERFANFGICHTGLQGGTIDNNTIEDIGVQTGMTFPWYADLFRASATGINGRWDEAAAISTSDNLIIEYNTISNVGYIGIAFVGELNTIRYNVIDTFMTKWNDGGGIYCISRPFGTGYKTQDCEVHNNFVTNGVGNLDGITASGDDIFYGEGIYLDAQSTRINVHHNTVEKVWGGLVSNLDTYENTFTFNISVDCYRSCLTIRQYQNVDYSAVNPAWEVLFPLVSAMTVEDNVLGVRSISQMCMELYSFENIDTFNPFGNGGNCDRNYYISPYRISVAKYVKNFGTTTTNYTLATWRTKISDEANGEGITDRLVFIDANAADVDLKLTKNITSSAIVHNVDDHYVDKDDTDPGTINIAAYYSTLTTIGLSVLDNFTGGAGSVASHTPDIGGTWVVPSGTISLNGSGELIASVNGQCYQELSSQDAVVKTIGKVSATGNGFNLMLRYTDANNWIQVQFLAEVTAANTRVRILNRSGGVLTEVATFTLGATYVINTYYRMAAKVVDDTIYVSMENQLRITYTNAVIAAQTGTKHGAIVNTFSTHDEIKMSSL